MGLLSRKLQYLCNYLSNNTLRTGLVAAGQRRGAVRDAAVRSCLPARPRATRLRAAPPRPRPPPPSPCASTTTSGPTPPGPLLA
ncbi:unnamed protein product [Plutella xylostella]|uniref:(diamondback moth) hypothetical protein n=1 Tax=Plutella xylostella TaxID=51655 RepID=A0A8S4G861_PLUXY|nr:unnamed protein product [Plutella xylostella]